jgi:hypothetical protein
MPRLMTSAMEHQRNIIVRPKGTTVEVVQLDDLRLASGDWAGKPFRVR